MEREDGKGRYEKKLKREDIRREDMKREDRKEKRLPL
jgi:hypothetical protein